MNIKCGTDIIEIDRIENAINKNSNFLKTVFTDNEIEYCEAHKIQKYQHYAARFAAKEATFKALSEKVQRKDLCWKSFEIVNSEDGKPQINISFEIEELQGIDISISHCKAYATATVIAEFRK